MTSRTSQSDRIAKIVKTTVLGLGYTTLALSFVAMMMLTLHVLTPKTALDMGEPILSTASTTHTAPLHANAHRANVEATSTEHSSGMIQ